MRYCLKAVRKQNQNKKIEKRLQVLVMHGEGKTQKEMQAATGFSRSYVNKIIKTYLEEGISAVGEAHYKGNRRNMSIEEEEALLAPFIAEAEAGQMVEVSKIKAAYVEKVGHEIGGGQIYYVLIRQRWRKVIYRASCFLPSSREYIFIFRECKIKCVSSE